MKNQNFIFITRFLAILGVITIHCAIYTNQYSGNYLNQFNLENVTLVSIVKIGYYGVHLFFFISGYCLSSSIFYRNEKTLKYFYIRRIFRIVPLYFIIGIFFYFIWRLFLNYYYNNDFLIDYSIYNFKNLISNIFFIHGFVISANNNIVPGGWSIANEMFYYILFPLIISFFKKEEKILFFFKQILLLTLILIFLNYLNYFSSENNYFSFIFKQTINPIIFFIFGIFYFNFSNFFEKNFKMFFLYSLLFFLILFFIYIFYKNIFIRYLILILAFFNIFLILKITRLNKKILPFIINYGKASYGAYLSHFFIIELLSVFLVEKYLNFIISPKLIFFVLFFMTLFLTYIVSMIINLTLEKKFINLGKKIINYYKN